MKSCLYALLLVVMVAATHAVSIDQMRMKMRRDDGSSDTASTSAPDSAIDSSSGSADSGAVSESLPGSSSEQTNATPLESQSGSGCSGLDTQSESDNCPKIVYTDGGSGIGSGSESAAGPTMSFDEAISPLDDWLKDFRKRMGAGDDLYSAAKATVQPLVARLRASQEAAEEKLRQSNAAILEHVEEATTEHVYQLLRSQKKASDRDEVAREQAETQTEAEQSAKEAAEEAKLSAETETEETSGGSVLDHVNELGKKE
jgi:hypothetical protein